MSDAQTETSDEVLAATTSDDASAEDPRLARLRMLADLAVPGLERTRAQVQSGLVTLAFDAPANAGGHVASVELSVTLCDGCAPMSSAERDALAAGVKAQLGDIHVKNPGLVFESRDLELLPQRVGAEVFASSFVDDGTTRAALRILDVRWAENGFALRFQAYPRTGFPATAAEHENAVPRVELESHVKTLFAAASAVLWPPATP